MNFHIRSVGHLEKALSPFELSWKTIIFAVALRAIHSLESLEMMMRACW